MSERVLFECAKGGRGTKGWLGWWVKGTANAHKPTEDAIAPRVGKHVPLMLDKTMLIRVHKATLRRKHSPAHPRSLPFPTSPAI